MRKTIITLCIIIIIVNFFISCQKQNEVYKNSSTNTSTSSESTNEQKHVDIINDDILTGVWQDQSEVASGLTNHYHIFPDGKFRFDYNEMVPIKGTISLEGKWTLEGNKLILDYETQIIVTGGTIGKIIPGEYGIIDMETQSVICKYVTDEYILSDLKINEDKNIPADCSILFEEHRYWKLNGADGNLNN